MKEEEGTKKDRKDVLCSREWNEESESVPITHQTHQTHPVWSVSN